MPVSSSIDSTGRCTLTFSGRLDPANTLDQYQKHLGRYIAKSNSPAIVYNFSNCTKAFPNVILPILCDYKLLELNKNAVSFRPPEDKELLKLFEHNGVLHQFSPSSYEPPTKASDKHLCVFHLSSIDQQQLLVNEIIDLLMRGSIIDSNVLDATRWIFNEITGNIFDHSESPFGGFVQLDVHKNGRIALTVCDGGIGILKSLQSSNSHQEIRTDADAIEYALRRGVTRDPASNQGNGLAGSIDLAKAFRGRISVRSGQGLFMWEYPTKFRKSNSCENLFGTLLDIQLDSNVAVNKQKLGTYITGNESTDYAPYDVLVEDYLDLESNTMALRLSDETFGTGNRVAGRQMFNKCMNLLLNTSHRIHIDWHGLPLIASSYADEFIGKLFSHLGPVDFSNRIVMTGIDEVNKKIINTVIMQRASHSYRS
ncbi:MAG: STAS-like domain-containing protein [Phycisphaerales bacterium]